MKTVFKTGGLAAGTGAPAEPTTPANLEALEPLASLSNLIDPDPAMIAGAAVADYRIRDRAASGRLYLKPTTSQTKIPIYSAAGLGTGPCLQFGFGGDLAQDNNNCGAVITPVGRTIIPDTAFSLFLPFGIEPSGNGEIMGGANRGQATPYWRCSINGNGFLVWQNDGNAGNTVVYNAADLRDSQARLLEIHHVPGATANTGTTTGILDGTQFAQASDTPDFVGANNRRLVLGSGAQTTGQAISPIRGKIGRAMIFAGRALNSGAVVDTTALAVVRQHYKDTYGIAVAGTT